MTAFESFKKVFEEKALEIEQNNIDYFKSKPASPETPSEKHLRIFNCYTLTPDHSNIVATLDVDVNLSGRVLSALDNLFEDLTSEQ